MQISIIFAMNFIKKQFTLQFLNVALENCSGKRKFFPHKIRGGCGYLPLSLSLSSHLIDPFLSSICLLNFVKKFQFYRYLIVSRIYRSLLLPSILSDFLCTFLFVVEKSMKTQQISVTAKTICQCHQLNDFLVSVEFAVLNCSRSIRDQSWFPSFISFIKQLHNEYANCQLVSINRSIIANL